MNTRYFFGKVKLLLFALALWPAMAHCSDTTLRIGYYPHYQIEKYRSLIERSYQRLGFDIQFVAIVSSQRSLLELEKGNIDAELMRSAATASECGDAVILEPPLLTAQVMLLCKQPAPCTPEVLSNPENTVIATNAQLKYWPADKQDELQANLVTIENVQSVYGMFSQGRYDYALVSIEGNTPPEMQVSFSHVNLHQVNGYHILNRKYEHLSALLTDAIKAEMQQPQG
ncbi:hypothetical protein DXV75_12520 [Alteromonas aestuariivivens]|uniref:Solute-binding protein family 3/N-terminal domain-containing protein n=1 Tax=Alteromonas aestuariivivens TaxID=1938339 RepID=A0A3D8M571_9ALTE|nr:hypothetical protein [Alteromonas aestuariivivens]RDV24887.1 hypothetical protein DXV75_12520 [Alteromonas aestuariivivens]